MLTGVTLAILGKGKSPLKQLQETLHNLEKAGAEIIAMPCNTAHHYYNELQESTNIPIINMISETAVYIYENFPNINKIGLLATAGTVKSGIYHKAITGMEVITPDDSEQEIVMNAILEVAKALIKRGGRSYYSRLHRNFTGVKSKDLPVPLIDSLQVLVAAVIREARGIFP